MSEQQVEQTPDATAQDDAAFDGDFDADKAKGLIAALRADKRKLQAKVKETEPSLAELAKIKADSQTELERWQTYAKEHEARAEKAERDALRSAVALAKGLPANLAARLQGDNQAALEADADELLALIPADTTPRLPRPDPSQGSSARGGPAKTPADEFAAHIRQLTGR